MMQEKEAVKASALLFFFSHDCCTTMAHVLAKSLLKGCLAKLLFDGF